MDIERYRADGCVVPEVSEEVTLDVRARHDQPTAGQPNDYRVRH